MLNDDVEMLPGWWPPLRAALDAGAAVAFPLTIDGAMRNDFAAWCFAVSRETLESSPWPRASSSIPSSSSGTRTPTCCSACARPDARRCSSRRRRIRHGLSETVASEDPDLRAWIAEQVARDRAAFERKHGTAVAGAAR